MKFLASSSLARRHPHATSSPFYLSPSDNPDEAWLHRRNDKKLTTSPEYHTWERTNSMVIAWIINSTDATLHGSISHTTTARDVWIDLEGRFAQTNAPRVHQLWRALNLIQQESNMSVTEYYNKFKSLTDELGEMQPLPQCKCGASKEITKRDKENHVHLFLGGLDADRFAQIKGTILNTDPLPSVKRVFNHILREESEILIDKSREVKVDIGAAFHVKNASMHRTKDEPKIKCDHYKKMGHEKAKCFELIGYPLNWENRRSKRPIKLNSGAAKFAWSGQRSFPDAEQSHALCGSQGKERDD
ncbi:gag-polypeptide of LTR copia-type [Sesbania bispinosa]|nr:gag-polypeptide of LTR copia-type [Sesbania bispinosa]